METPDVAALIAAVYFAAAITVWLAMLLNPVARQRYPLAALWMGVLWPVAALAITAFLIGEIRAAAAARDDLDLPGK